MTTISITRLYGRTKVKIVHFDDPEDFADILLMARTIDGNAKRAASKAKAERLSLVCAANHGATRKLYHEGRVVIFTNPGAT